MLLKRVLVYLCAGLFAIFLQGTVFKSIFGGVSPDLTLLIVVYMGLSRQGAFGALMAFLIGLEYDLFSQLLLGPRSASLVVTYGCLSLLSQRMFFESWLASIFALLVGSAINTTVYLLLIHVNHGTSSFVLSILSLEAILTAVLGTLLAQLMRRLFRARSRKSYGQSYERLT